MAIRRWGPQPKVKSIPQPRWGAQPTVSSGPEQANYTAPQTTALPVDPSYDATIAGLGNKRDNTVGSYQQGIGEGLLNSGYTASYGADGSVSGLQYDPNNPYSQASLARKVYQQQKTGTGNSMAARGQLYSGALVNAQNANDSNFSVGEDTRQKALLSFINRSQSGIANAGTDYNLGAGQALGDRIVRAPSMPGYNAATTTTPTGKPTIKPIPKIKGWGPRSSQRSK